MHIILNTIYDMYSLYVVLDGLYLFLFCMNYPLYMLVSDHLLDLQILLFPISYTTNSNRD